MKIVVVALVLCAFGIDALAEKETPNWVQVTEEAQWLPRDSAAEVAFDGKLWIMGGWFQSFEAPPRDVWSSEDGKTWTKVTDSTPWVHSDLPMSIAFKDRMWVMGGWYNGRLPGHSASNRVWWSTNGKDWTQATDRADWSPRLSAALVEFKGKMWILGGQEDYYFGNARNLKNDVWSSEDGVTWELVTEHAGWSPRGYHQAAVLNGKIYVFGGGNYVPDYQALNDVWSSEDGKTWVQETDAAPWSPRLWFSSAVYRDRMWVIGGWSNNPSENWDDVWYSKDGKTWKEYAPEVKWKERHEHSVYVFEDKLWVAAGMIPPLNSEVWSLHIPKDWFDDEE